METSKIYLCKSDCSILGNISGIKIETCNLKKHAVEQWEITFDVERYISNNSCELKQSDYYDSIDVMMRLYLDGNDQIFFVIDSEPVINGEGLQEVKTVTAHSIECELSTLFLRNFKINCGTKDSQEYLATDSNGNFNNIDPYTTLPYEYISLVNYNNSQLSLLHLALQNTGWTVDENIDPEICSIKKSFDVSETNIYDFFINIVSPSASIIFQFDRKYKKINLVKAENFGEDTGIFVTMRNLMNSFEITSSSNDDLITKLVPTGANNFGIEQVNYEDYIINLDYFMNTLNEYGDYKYVSKDLHDKYNLWKNYREKDLVTFNEKQCTRREQYIELTKLYNKTILDITDLKNRVPNDGAVTDYKTFSLDELKLHLNAYNKALVSLITIYKNEYGVTEIGEAPNYTPTPSSAVNIKDTPYWYDYYAYQESIIPQIKEALKMYCQTDSNGNLMTDINGNFIEMEFGNPNYYSDPSIVKEVDAYKYEWSLYGLDELESKKKAWCEVANLLFNECFIESGTIAAPTAYRTPDDNGWNSLSESQKKEFTSKSAYIDKLNNYLDYMSFDIRNNSLTKTQCKGIIRQCDDVIISRKNEIDSIEKLQNSYQTQRKELVNSVNIKNFKVNNILLFTEKDLNIINSMIKEQDYNNPNIITTNLDDIVTSVDAQEELYQAAVKELYKLSQPQYSFSTDMDNLYALEEFKYFHDDFKVGNFIRAGFEIHEELFDNEFIKLRLMSITYNPLEKSNKNISVEFSTMIKEFDGVSDLASIFGENNSSSSSSSSSSSGGTYGNNDANVQMSNNMINALLSTELFGTTVTDVILDSIKGNKGNFNTLFSHSGVFDSLEAGRIKVSGDCLFDRIRSSNYSSLNKIGSYFDVANGTFESFSANGHFIKNDGNNISIKMENFSIDNEGNAFFKGDISGSNGLFTGSVNVNNKFFVDDKGNVTAHGSLTATDAYIEGSVMSESSFINGDIEADTLKVKTTGSIAGWTFDENGFYKNDNNIGKQNGAYIGNNGISVGDYFIISNDGAIIKSNFEYDVYPNRINFPNNSSIVPISIISVTLTNINIDENFQFIICSYYSAMINNVSSGINTYLHISGVVQNSNNFNPNKCEYNEAVENFNTRNLDIANIICSYNTTSKELVIKIPHTYISGFREQSLQFIESISNQIKNITVNNISYNGDILYRSFGIKIDTNNNEISGDNFCLYPEKLSLYRDFVIQYFDESNSETPTVKIDKNGLIHKGLSNLSSGDNLVISNGTFYRKSSSSKRYKNSIELLSKKIKSLSDLNPHKLYDIDIVSFRYNDNYLPDTDQRYQKDIPGLIAEDVYKKYPIACNLDKDGNPEMWDINIMFPAALKLIQELNDRVTLLENNTKSTETLELEDN